MSERLIQPEQVYKKVHEKGGASEAIARRTLLLSRRPIKSADTLPGRPDEWTLLGRTCMALGYFAILTMAFAIGIPSYATVPLIFLGVAGLIILALLAGVYWTTPNVGQRRQVNLLTLFIFTAACAMLLGTVTGLLRASGRTGAVLGTAEWIVTIAIAGLLFLFSFPFAGYLAETFIWSAAGLVRIPKVRALFQRLMP